jgi:transposase InsO family protein
MRREAYRYDAKDTKQKLIDKLYNDPSYGFVGQEKLYRKAKALNREITHKDIKDYYESRVDIQRFKLQKPNYEQFKIASPNPDSWQIDLAFWFKKTILTCININSRLGYAAIVSNKQAKTVIEALDAFVKANKPSIITSDNGKEFMARAVQRFFKQKGIEHYNNEAGDHSTMGKIERFNRTIKQRLMQIPNREDLTPKLLKAIIDNYNTSEHRSIGMTPKEAKGHVATSENEHNQEVMQKLNNELDIGASVLYRLQKGAFDKEDARWSKAVYEIVDIDGYKVQIRSKNGKRLYKRPNDLKIVNAKITNAVANKGDLFDIKEILKHRKVEGKHVYLIQWEDFDKPTWEPQDNLRLVNKNRMSGPEKKYFKALEAGQKAKQ